MNLSRICLDWETCLAFHALAAIDEKMMIQAALLADACEEPMVLIRFLDEAKLAMPKFVRKWLST